VVDMPAIIDATTGGREAFTYPSLKNKQGIGW